LANGLSPTRYPFVTEDFRVGCWWKNLFVGGVIVSAQAVPPAAPTEDRAVVAMRAVEKLVRPDLVRLTRVEPIRRGSRLDFPDVDTVGQDLVDVLVAP
jgi:hypothetical protein